MSSVIIRRPKTVESSKEKQPEKRKIYGAYMKSTLERKVCLHITEIGKNVKQNLEAKLENSLGGKCVQEGYMKSKSIQVISYSSGTVNYNVVEFRVLFDVMVCLPVEGMLIECMCKTITKAGIHAQVVDEDNNIPVTIFVARDHHHMEPKFSEVKEGDQITARVIGIRYELNDDYICAIGKLV